MRVLVAVLALGLSMPAVAAGPRTARQPTLGPPAANCPNTTSYLADKSSLYRGEPLAPRKLTELPSAAGYMAVYRVINGCEAPLTMVDYRRGVRR
ncbi:MAG: hypothetical protein ACJ8EH_12720 [Sphingomicrobium sp.]